MKTVTVVGARPQFIKAAMVSQLLRSTPNQEEVLIHTDQHYDKSMSNVFFQELEVPQPDYHLGIGSHTHGVQTGRMLEAIERVLLQEQPDWVIVYGDTNSTLAGAIAAVKLHIPVAHVEAGLRSYNRQMPEEINRVLTDHACDLLFAPTETAVENLRREGLSHQKIHLVGDVMYDAALYYAIKAQENSHILEQLNLSAQGYILATIHRAENTDHPLQLGAIVNGLAAVAQKLPIVLPLHPRTRNALKRDRLLEMAQETLQIIPPVGYLDMVMLEKNARLIATDSGGVQKEAFFHQVPCVTLRTETEWIELVELGWNHLVAPTDADAVREGLIRAIAFSPHPTAPRDLYGGGQAAQQIVDRLTNKPIVDSGKGL